MLKQYAKYHYGIKKCIEGDGCYAHDGWVLDENYRPLKYIYRASANYICDQLNKAHSGRVKFYVARFD